MLQETMSALPEEEARYHLQRCIDSGLWVPNASSENNEAKSFNEETAA